MKTTEIPISPDRPAYEADHRSRLSRIIQHEYLCVSCVLGNAKAKFGPNLCTFPGYWLYWESPEASKIGEAIQAVIKRDKPPFRWLVMAALEPEYRRWPQHPSFTEDVYLGMAEHVAGGLLLHYEGKRIQQSIGDAWNEIKVNPAKARQVAAGLRTTLERYA